ncbi:hypothetical protein R5R35_014568 [Gryllus longicercus]|uniref:Uncharacterized protein n=1 Tax=Gryllus longicercus TaxID=2509291 RepID=A0AAN9VC02_9ORTH
MHARAQGTWKRRFAKAAAAAAAAEAVSGRRQSLRDTRARAVAARTTRPTVSPHAPVPVLAALAALPHAVSRSAHAPVRWRGIPNVAEFSSPPSCSSTSPFSISALLVFRLSHRFLLFRLHRLLLFRFLHRLLLFHFLHRLLLFVFFDLFFTSFSSLFQHTLLPTCSARAQLTDGFNVEAMPIISGKARKWALFFPCSFVAVRASDGGRRWWRSEMNR